MGDFEKIFVGVILMALAIFITPLMGTLAGAFSGWVGGLFFEGTIRETLGGVGVNPTTEMWQIGATLGFLGGFVRVVKKADA